MHEYGWTISHTLAVPLAQAFALYAAIAVRYGNDFAGPSYFERQLLAAVKAAAPPPPRKKRSLRP